MQNVEPNRSLTHVFGGLKGTQWKILPFLFGALLLAGCASTKVEGLPAISSQTTPVPSSLGISVTVSPELESDTEAKKVAQVLQSDLVKYYGKAGLQTFIAAGEPIEDAAALVSVRIDNADKGDRAARVLIGFGAGRSELETDVTIEIPGQTEPAMAFSATAKSGRSPGMIVPIGLAGATGKIYRLAIGAGTGLLTETGSDLNDDAARSAKLIVKQTRELYRSSGWVWPSDEPVEG